MSVTPSCIILAGGLGTRLRVAVPDKPKCLAPVGDKSFLQIQLELLASQGVKDFVLSLGYLAKMILLEVDRLKSQFSIRTVLEKEPLGTGGALLFAMHTVGQEEVLVTNGDTFLGGSLSDMLLPLDLAGGELARMAVIEVSDRSRYGGVEFSSGRVSGFAEKGKVGSGLINAGFYRLHRNALGSLNPGEAFSFEATILPSLARQGQLGAAKIEGEFTDIGLPEDYFRFCKKYG